MTFEFKRYDPPTACSQCDDFIAAGDGDWVGAEDAINREAVNADKIRTLEVQLKEARLEANRLRGHLAHKNEALVNIKKILNAEFDRKE